MLCEWSAIALAIDAAYGRFDAACYIGRPMPYDIRFERILQIETLSNRSRSNGSMQTTSSGHSLRFESNPFSSIPTFVPSS